MEFLSAWLSRFSHWSTWIWPELMEHLWQATLFVGVALLAVSLLRQAPARARYAVWVIAFAKFALPTAVFVYVLEKSGFQMPAVWGSWLGFVGTASALNMASEWTPNQLFPILTALWIGGSALFFLRWGHRYRQMSLLMKSQLPVTKGREARIVAEASRRVGLEAPPALILSREIEEPGVWGVSHPVVVLPLTMVQHLDDEELEAVVLHELTHVARKDNLVGNLTMALCCLFWFHPLVWWIDRRLLSERERVCDDRVLQELGGSEVYASSLLKVIRFRLGFGVIGMAGVAGSHLGQRIRRIISGRPNLSLSLWHRAIVVAMASFVLMLSMTVETTLKTYSGDDGIQIQAPKHPQESSEKSWPCRKSTKPPAQTDFTP